MITSRDKTTFLNRQSFLELDARGRAAVFFDQGTSRELVGPFDRVESPWLAIQDVTPQEDDGCVVMKGKIAGKAAVVVALEGAFQGGSMGEVSGEKMTAALDLAAADSEKGTPTSAVILLETGGVRLQEANLGLAAVAEVMASVLTLRKHAPVICVSAGTVGCFGGMSLAAGLSSYIVLTREARLGLNGPEVIEQESGIEEWDSSNRALVFAINGGEQRYAMGLADALVEDDTPQIADAVRGFIAKGLPHTHRSSQVELYRGRIDSLDTSRQWDPNELRRAWGTVASEEGANDEHVYWS
jgi:malonate decarboxylase beta subunit